MMGCAMVPQILVTVSHVGKEPNNISILFNPANIDYNNVMIQQKL